MIGRLTTWRMLFQGIRQMDGDEMGLLKRFCDTLDQAWEDYLYDRATAILTLQDVDAIDRRWLPLLKSQLGFTQELSFDASEAELRRVLTRAVPFWNDKPTELGVIAHAIRMITGNRFRARNYFDYRIVIDETCLGEEWESFDAWAIDFPSKAALDLDLTLDGDSFTLDDPADLPGGQFLTPYEYRWLHVREPEALRGSYHIASLVPYDVAGTVEGEPFPGTPTAATGDLYGAMDEYITSVRLVDDGLGELDYDEGTLDFLADDVVRGMTSGALAEVVSVTGTTERGTLSLRGLFKRFVEGEEIESANGLARVKGKMRGILNRDLLRFLVEVIRPSSERVKVSYIHFLDLFETANDLDQWEVSGGVEAAEAGRAHVPAGGMLLANPAEQAKTWKDCIALVKFKPEELTTVADFILRYWSADAFYYIRLDYAAAGGPTVSLVKRLLGSDSTLATSAPIPYLYDLDVTALLRIEATNNEALTKVQFRVLVDAEEVIQVEDSTNPRYSGGIGFRSTAGGAFLSMVELDRLPMETDDIGPPPDEPDTSFAYSGGWVSGGP